MSRLVPSSLAGRLVLTAVALLAIVSLVVTVSSTLVMRSYLYGQLDQDLAESLDRADRAIRTDVSRGPGTPDPSDDFGGAPPPIPFGQGVGSITSTRDADGLRGVVITESGERQDLSQSALASLAEVEIGQDPTTISLPALGSYRVASTTTPSGAIVWQALPTDGVDNTIASLLWWESLLAIAGVGAAGVAGGYLVRRQLQPLREVAAAAHQVTAMPLSSGQVGRTVRLPADLTDPSTEVGQVGEALNLLLGHVEGALDARHESEQQVRQFLADASHELRTPLSTIRGYSELHRRTGGQNPDEILAKVESEAGRMTTLVEDMLLLARLDAGRPIDRKPVDVTRLVVEAVEDARVVDPERQWTLTVATDPVITTGEEQQLHQAVTNLLSNATRHTPPGTTVDVQLTAGEHLTISVHDDGPGLDVSLLPSVFERFSRGDSSRTRSSGGAGLGMSLVKAIMQAHGGDASVVSTPGDTTFTLTLPPA